MYRLHAIVLQNFPQCKSVVARRFHSRNYSGFAVLLCKLLHPCLKCLKINFGVAELHQFLCVLVATPVECSGIVGLASHINSGNQSFFSYGDNFCVLCVTIHLGIPLCSIRFFTNRAKSVILFYSEVSFYQLPFLEFLIFELYRKLLSGFGGFQSDRELGNLILDSSQISEGVHA